MCLLFLALDSHPDYPVIAAANRDEFYARPTRRVHTWEDHDQVIAGRDMDRGGTWFGISRNGRWAAVTNYRESDATVRDTSRGDLVSDFLSSDPTPEEYVDDLASRGDRYAGFNLVVGAITKVMYYSNRDRRVRRLDKGVYGLSNHLLDTPWPKVSNGKQNLLNLLNHGKPGPDSLFRILNDPDRAADSELSDSGMGMEWERLLSSAFICGDTYGTRSSTILLVDRDNRLKLEERTYASGASGPPDGYSSVAYEFDVQ